MIYVRKHLPLTIAGGGSGHWYDRGSAPELPSPQSMAWRISQHVALPSPQANSSYDPAGSNLLHLLRATSFSWSDLWF